MATTKRIECDVKDLNLAPKGKARIEWANQWMPVLALIRKRFIKERPLAGVRVAACLHVTTETANLAIALRDAGAEVVVCASNPLSTQDDVAASLVADSNIPVFATKGEDESTYYSHILAALESHPQITLDDGADLVTTVLTKCQGQIPEILGGTEETTTGVIRLRSMAKQGVLKFPIVAVNDADTKHLFDNRYGTGQSTLDGIIRATNLLIAGLRLVISGYGWCGRGVALRAKGMGAAKIGDVFITLTGDKSVITSEHMKVMKNGAVICNSGHFNVEVDIPALEKMSFGKRRTREYVDEYSMGNGRRIYLLGEGRLINLAAAEGHPAAVMDMSFANQALSVEYIVKNAKKLEAKVYSVPPEIDHAVARLKLDAMGIVIDKLTPDQEHYLASWSEGT